MSGGKWDGWPMLGFDLETTGINAHGDRIVTAALHAIWDNGGRRLGKTATYVVDPGIEIPEGAAAIHGYTTARAQAEATHTPEQMLFEITGRLAVALGKGIPVVGANISYDLTMLEAENRRHDVDTLIARLGPGKVQPIIDVMVLDRFADTFRKGGRKLTDLCKHYGVTLGDDAHDAGADARAACELWPRIMGKHARKFPGHTIDSLHQLQVGARERQMNSLRGYFDSKGTEHDGCCGEWPIHARCAPKTPAPAPAPAGPPAPEDPPF